MSSSPSAARAALSWASQHRTQERDALKNVGLAAAMTAALVARGYRTRLRISLANWGVLAFKRGYTQWSAGDRDDARGLAHHALAALGDLRAAAATLR